MTTLRLARPGDEGRLRDFLSRHLETSMFLLGNLERHGLGDSAHPHATRYHLLEDGGNIGGVLAATRGGYLMGQLPGAALDHAARLLAPFRGSPLLGMTGDAPQVARVIAHLDLPAGAWVLNRVEPLMALDPGRLAPPLRAAIRPGPAHRPLLQAWFAGLVIDTGTAHPDHAATLAHSRAEAALADGDVWLWPDETGTPVAMAGINARAGDAVQVGGVYVPPELRGRGLAGQAIGAVLAQEQARGARKAILFAATETATRLYQRMGFRRIGEYRVALLTGAPTLELRP